MIKSLSTRLLIAVSLVLTAFLGLSAISLNNAFESSAKSAQEKRLKNYVYMLLTAANMRKDGQLIMPKSLAEPKFSIPNSGLYAQITNNNKVIWQSPSAIGSSLQLPFHPKPAKQEYNFVTTDSGALLRNLAFGVLWEKASGGEVSYTINVAEDMAMLDKLTYSFKLTLWYWLGGTWLMLMITLALILRWSLRPLHNVTMDLNAIETGEKQRLSEDYPIELQHLTQNINNLLNHEESRRVRYKNSLADLAHNLKTPISVLRGELESNDDNDTLKAISYEQLDIISRLVNYQLQQASTEGKNGFLTPVSLGDIVHKITRTLDKVYKTKNVSLQQTIDRDAFIHADEGDMYELLGNLLDNAYKYCHQKVHIVVNNQVNKIIMRIEDDGAGIPVTAESLIIKRGQRIDTQEEGQGLGLAIVHNIINAYQGTISLSTSSFLGGSSFTVELPTN